MNGPLARGSPSVCTFRRLNKHLTGYHPAREHLSSRGQPRPEPELCITGGLQAHNFTVSAVDAATSPAGREPAREAAQAGQPRTSMRWLRRMRRMQESGLSGGTPLSSGVGRFIDPCRHRPPPTDPSCSSGELSVSLFPLNSNGFPVPCLQQRVKPWSGGLRSLICPAELVCICWEGGKVSHYQDTDPYHGYLVMHNGPHSVRAELPDIKVTSGATVARWHFVKEALPQKHTPN